MSNNKFTIGQLVSATDVGFDAYNTPGIVLAISESYTDPCYFVALANRLNPMPSSREGWFFHESELTALELPIKAKRKTLSVRKSLTPSAAAIAAHLKREGNISGVEAAAMFKTRQLPGRISELRAAGYDIASNFDHDTSPTKQRYVRYHLVKAPELIAA